jgi:3-isopropylmalate/(R)-2-methylmalate dehydratase small subunit
VVVPEAVVVKIWEAIEADPSTEIVVDMERLTVEVPSAGITESFPMEPQNQHRFINGLDDVGITLTHVGAIDSYETKRPAWLR